MTAATVVLSLIAIAFSLAAVVAMWRTTQHLRLAELYDEVTRAHQRGDHVAALHAAVAAKAYEMRWRL